MTSPYTEIQYFLINNLPEYRCRFKGRLDDFKNQVAVSNNDIMYLLKEAFEKECKFDIAVDIQYRIGDVCDLTDILIVLESVDIEHLLLIDDSMMDEQKWIQ